MKLVIEIPDEEYEFIKNPEEENPFGWLSTKNTVRNAIVNGIHLPKGHGRLKDIDEIDWYGCTTEYDCPYKNRDCKDCDRAECSKTQVDGIPVLIPADKESEDAECRS